MTVRLILISAGLVACIPLALCLVLDAIESGFGRTRKIAKPRGAGQCE